MPQIASGAGWTTSLEYANLGSAAAHAQVNPFDDRGEAALLPFKMSLFQANIRDDAGVLLNRESFDCLERAGSQPYRPRVLIFLR